MKKPPATIHPNVDPARLKILNETVDLMGNPGRQEREIITATDFLTGLRIEFDDYELRSAEIDPPDVLFREFRMEIKELLDPGRKRHKEYKDSRDEYIQTGEIAKESDTLAGIHGMLTSLPKLPPEEVFRKHAFAFTKEYSENCKRRKIDISEIDLVFYCNLWSESFSPQIQRCRPKKIKGLCKLGFRSVSMVTNQGDSFVFCAKSKAPLEIRNALLAPPTPSDWEHWDWPQSVGPQNWRGEIPTKFQPRWSTLPSHTRMRSSWFATMACEARLSSWIFKPWKIIEFLKWRFAIVQELTPIATPAPPAPPAQRKGP